ncbi:MAG TPA: response regulator, partial [Candidatus Hydrogenedentes bacterium]|nr:response regulator [Candidatus Hydrogenedentota bacterium]
MAKATILVIDDESLMREYVQEALVRAGHDVTVASNGKDGIEAIARKTFDVVVSDLKMQPVDGVAVLRAVRTKSPATACIIMTAYGTVETAVTALKEGAFDYQAKPFDADRL